VIRIGIVDFDTSHVVQFSKRLNHVNIDEEQWVEGGKIVLGYRGTSEVTEKEKMDTYEADVRACGVEMVERPEDMIGQIDAVLIESQAGSVHLERVRPFLEAKIPAFVDKPFAATVEQAREMVRLAEGNGVALFSSSSLRFTPEVIDVTARVDEIGNVVGANAYSPAGLHEKNPGLLHYGIHGVETLYALMGPGCQYVWTVFTEGAEVTTGLWGNGRIGVVRGTRAGAHSYGFTVWGEKKVHQAAISTQYIYRELLKKIIETFQTGQPAVPLSETTEIIGFIEAAKQSADNNGARVPVHAL